MTAPAAPLALLGATLVRALSGRYGLGGALTFLAIALVGGAASMHLPPETRGRQVT